MSLIYRAIWQDDIDDVVEFAEQGLGSWIAHKRYDGLDATANEPQMREYGQDSVSLEITRVADGGLVAIEASLTEERPDERWMTRLRAMSDSRQTWFWVDLERVASDIFRRPLVVAPRLVRLLIESGNHPRIGPAPIATAAKKLRPAEAEAELVQLILNPSRTTPVIVFSHDPSAKPAVTMDRANKAAETLAGVARVFAISPEGQARFDALLGSELSVFRGSARMFLPGNLDAWRHRYLRSELVQRHPRSAGQLFGKMLSASIAARRAPEMYDKVRPLLRATSDATADELLEVAEVEAKQRNAVIEDLRSQLEQDESARLDALAEVETLQQQLVSQRSTIRSLMVGNDVDSVATEDFELPEFVSSLVEVAELTASRLENVVLPESACCDLEELDQTVEADSWAQTSWQGMRALNSYARGATEVNGTFWQWCKAGRSADGWPATPKKLAMRESETVMNTERLRACRLLPVSTEVDSAGSMLMEAHLKIAEGGGGNAPRIYFHDHTGVDGKIHIGFFGPHRYMPNTKTN